MHRRCVLPALILLVVVLFLASCDLFGGSDDNEVKKLLFIDVIPNKSVFADGDNIKDCITVKSFYSDSSEKLLQNEDYQTNLFMDTVTSDTNSVTITYEESGITKTKDIKVYKGDRTLSGIEIVTMTDFFYVGDNIKDYIVVQSVYSDGTKSVVSRGRYTVSPTDVVCSTTTSVEISYTEGNTKTIVLPITIGSIKTLDSIDVITKTDVFIEGHNIKDYIIVQGVYSDGTVKNVLRDKYDISPSETVTSPTTSVTVSYEEDTVTRTKILSFTIGSGKNLISIDVTPNKSFFYEGDDIKDNITVTGYYSDGSEQPIISYNTDPTNGIVTSTTNSVKVIYREDGITMEKTMSIINKTLIDIEVTTKTDVFVEDENVRDYILVQSVHADGTKVILPKDSYDVSPTDIITSTTDMVEISYSGKTKIVSTANKALTTIDFNVVCVSADGNLITEFDAGDFYWKYEAISKTGSSMGQTSNPTWIKQDQIGLSEVAGFGIGEWDVSLFAFADSEGNNLVYEGKAEQVKFNGVSITVTVFVSPIQTPEAKGIIRFISVTDLTEIQLKKRAIDISDKDITYEIQKGGTSYVAETTITSDTELEVNAGNYSVILRCKNSDGTEYARSEIALSVFNNLVAEVDVFSLKDKIEITDEEHEEMFSVDATGGVTFEKDKELPESLTFPSMIGDTPVVALGDMCCAEANNDNLKHVFIEEGIREIGEVAFASCDNLETVELPNSLVRISLGAFAYCKSLTTINLPEGLEYIGDGVFAGCTALTEITLPESLTELGNNVFTSCTSLEHIYFNGTSSEYEEMVKGNDIFLDCGVSSVECLK